MPKIMHDFQPGDVVICVDDSGTYGDQAPVKGEKSVVDRVTPTDIILKGAAISWSASRFKLVSGGMKPAAKEDEHKARWDIVMRIPGLSTVVDVFTFGAKKYEAFNWRKAKGDDGYKFRLLAAAMRHISKRFLGEKLDSESQKPHLAHAIADLLMVLDLDA